MIGKHGENYRKAWENVGKHGKMLESMVNMI